MTEPQQNQAEHPPIADLTPKAYRAMFGLGDDYPLVAPAYASTRSALAKKIGLGRKLCGINVASR